MVSSRIDRLTRLRSSVSGRLPEVASICVRWGVQVRIYLHAGRIVGREAVEGQSSQLAIAGSVIETYQKR